MDTTQMNFSDFGYGLDHWMRTPRSGAHGMRPCGGAGRRRWHAAAAGAGGGRRVRGLERQTDGSDVAIAD